MSPGNSGRLVILSGPSCVGKSSLFGCLAKFYPEVRKQLHKLVLVNSRDPRPGEIDGVDYYFRARAQVEALRTVDRYVVLEARTDLQALDIEELESLLRQGDAFFEGNPYVARALHNNHASVASLRLLFTFAPERRSASLRNRCSPSPEYPPSLTSLPPNGPKALQNEDSGKNWQETRFYPVTAIFLIYRSTDEFRSVQTDIPPISG